MALAGHWWTVAPALASRLRAPRPLAASHGWRLAFADPAVGDVTLTGFATPSRGGDAVLLLHGLGGSALSSYLFPLERELAARGWTTLRLHLRGADRRGDDFAHAGFTADLPRVLAAPPLAAARRIALVGVSLGGHLALRFAAEGGEERLSAVVSVCSPLDLDRSAAAIDAPAAWVYRSYLLRAMNEVYAAVAARGRAPLPVETMRRARRIRDWDALAVAARFGFASAEDYYARASVAPLLAAIRIPAWIVAATGDPMVPAATVRPALAGASASTEVTWTARGGHAGFPAVLDLGAGPRLGLAGQVAAWLEART